MKCSPEPRNAILHLKKETKPTFVLCLCRGTDTIQLINGCSFALNFGESLDLVSTSRWVIEVQHLTEPSLQSWNTGPFLDWTVWFGFRFPPIVLTIVNTFSSGRKKNYTVLFIQYQIIQCCNSIWIRQFANAICFGNKNTTNEGFK